MNLPTPSPVSSRLAPAFFVTGTDTDAGKTFVSALLLKAIRNVGNSVLAMKPIASGCTQENGIWLNSDVEILRNAASHQICRDEMNPFRFPPAISPHLAAADAGVCIDLQQLQRTLQGIRAQAQYVLVEGAGGWFAPLSQHQTMADLAAALNLPVLLVVGMRLGCLNHARLSVAAIQQSGRPFLGWIANSIDPHMARFDDNLAYLSQHLGPPLAVVAHNAQTIALDCEHFLSQLEAK